MNMPTPPTPLPPHIPQALRACFSAQRDAFQRQRNPGLEQRRADLRALHRLLVDNRQALVDAGLLLLQQRLAADEALRLVPGCREPEPRLE